MKYHLLFSVLIILLGSCGIIEKSSRHDFQTGFYNYSSNFVQHQKVYVESGEKIIAYPIQGKIAAKEPLFDISLQGSDSVCLAPIKFSKNSLDIDFTTVLFKFRPSIYHLPAQLNTDFNASIYAGWRHDNYYLRIKSDPKGQCSNTLVNRGYDFGLFAGPGGTTVGPFSTRNAVSNEYNGFIIQYGLAGFLESNMASFGISAGMDRLFSPDNKYWIYRNKPWIGFMVGIALN